MDERELIGKVIGGEHEAFNKLQSKWEVPLKRFVWRLLGRNYVGEEIVQEAFLILFVQIKNGRSIRNLRPFLYRVVRNLCYDELRRKKRRMHLSLDDELINVNGLADPYRDHDLPEEALLDNELYREVHKAMNELPELQRQTLILFYQEELPYIEIAEIMGVDIGTIKSRLHYAKRMLRNILKNRRYNI